MLLTKEQLLTRQKLEITKIEFENDEYVYVRQMTGRERDTFESSLTKAVRNDKNEIISYERALEDFRAKMAVCVLCDENGNLLLEPSDYIALSESMSAKRLEKIINVAQKINRMTDADKEALIKNSEAGQAGSSSSDSVNS